MAGLAGALAPELAVADLIVDEWFERIALPIGAKRGKIYTADRIAARPGDKAALYEQTGALAVDMENAVVRDWARKNGAEFGAIRAISDRADQMLDPMVLNLVDSWGRPKPLSVLSTLILRPSLLPHLLRLGADSKKAARRLGEAVRQVVDQMSRQVPAPTPSTQADVLSQSHSSSSNVPLE